MGVRLEIGGKAILTGWMERNVVCLCLRCGLCGEARCKMVMESEVMEPTDT